MIEAYVDGGCNNRTKRGAYGSYAVFGKNELLKSESFILPATTSNQAEYMAMIKLLEYIRFNKRLKNKKMTVYCDSRLIVNQIANGWRTREPTLKILNRRAKGLYKGIKKYVEIVWVGRDEIFEVLGH